MARRLPYQDPAIRAHLNSTVPSRSGSTMSHLLVAVDEGSEGDTPTPLGRPNQTFKLPPPISLWQEEAPSCWDGDEDDELWRADLRWDGNNHIRHFQTNVEIILEKSLVYRGALAYDEFTNRVVILRPIPGGGKAGDHFSERHVLAFRAFCEVRLDVSFRDSLIDDAVKAVAFRNRRHQIRDFLDRLVWDGEPRLDHLADRYFGADPTEYNRTVMRKFILSAVARAYEPGCKADNCVVLEGGQGVFKSTSLKIMFLAANLVNDTPLDLKTKDAYIGLQGRWCIEFAELDSLTKVDYNRIKAILSGSNDSYRGVHERHTTDHPRTCLFVGTCNESSYLPDPTGGRRFWPVKVGRIDLEGLIRDRLQLWAEAVECYKAGDPWHLTSYEDALARVEQELRRQEDPWEAPIAKYIIGREKVTTDEILKNALALKDYAINGQAARRVSQILVDRFHWRRTRFFLGTSKVNGYVPPTTTRPAQGPAMEEDVEVDD